MADASTEPAAVEAVAAGGDEVTRSISHRPLGPPYQLIARDVLRLLCVLQHGAADAAAGGDGHVDMSQNVDDTGTAALPSLLPPAIPPPPLTWACVLVPQPLPCTTWRTRRTRKMTPPTRMHLGLACSALCPACYALKTCCGGVWRADSRPSAGSWAVRFWVSFCVPSCSCTSLWLCLGT
jgi:hypothetical protein